MNTKTSMKAGAGSGLRYWWPAPIDRTAAEEALASGDIKQTCEALVRLAYHEADWRWVQEQCIRFAVDPKPELRASAATCLGHLAFFHRTLDLDRVLPLFDSLLNDKGQIGDYQVAGYAEDALEEIKMFVRSRSLGEEPCVSNNVSVQASSKKRMS